MDRAAIFYIAGRWFLSGVDAPSPSPPSAGFSTSVNFFQSFLDFCVFLKKRPYNSIINNETEKKMKLFHTSPAKIEKINNRGRFGEFLFFSPSVYVMTAGDFVSYELELDDSAIIEASAIFYQDNADLLSPLVVKIARRYDVDTETAEKLIDESESIFNVECNVDPEDLADASWDIQRATAQAAKLIGYRGVKVTDEQGSAYMIDVMGREAEMTISEMENND